MSSIVTSAIPSYSFSSLEEAMETMQGHNFQNLYIPLSSVSVLPTGHLQLEGREEPISISDLGVTPLVKSVGLPAKNITLLPADRVSEDLNFLLKNSPHSVNVRLVDGLLYDIKRAKEIETPTDHTQFLSRISKNLPTLNEHLVDGISFKGGRFKLRTRHKDADIAVTPGDYNSYGLEFVNSDYGKYFTQVSYHIYRTECSNSAVGISGQLFRANSENDVPEQIALCGNRMLADTELLGRAYKQLANNALSEYTFRIIFSRLCGQLGNKTARQLIFNYISVKDEESETGRRKKSYQFDSNESQLAGKTEYDFFNDITWSAKSLDSEQCWRAQTVAGSLITDYVRALRTQESAVV